MRARLADAATFLMVVLPHSFLLYGTSACHLCDEAKALFLAVVPAEIALLQEVDISASDALVELYGVRIPVLSGLTASGEQRELGWPFDEVQLGEFVDAVIDAVV
jgi:hypothetical protein